MHKSKYKPLLFTTTVRSPERLKGFLFLLKQFDGEILTEEIIEKVILEILKKGLYRPTRTTDLIKVKWKQDVDLTEEEAKSLFLNNPQEHKEAGFDRGWPSRFDTWFKLAKELGFVYYWQDEPIKFSESGLLLLDEQKPENEQMVFANSFAKYQRDNPFKKVLNKNTPLVLLLETINLLNQDETYNGAGISKAEIPILLCWKDNNAKELYREIKSLREKYGFKPSSEVILDICYNLLDQVKRDDKSILVDYPDDFIRKMRLTGLITLRGGGRFVDINTKEQEAVNYILENYTQLKSFENEKSFFKYIGEIDQDLISKLTVFKAPIRTTNNELAKWVSYYNWDQIKKELLILANKGKSQDEILRVIENPLRLEFLTSLAIIKKLPKVSVKPNFISDDEGLPTSFASGENPDIECKEENKTILIEVTLLTGTQQHIRESYSIQRHLIEYKDRGLDAFTLFLSPKTFKDTQEHAKFIKHQYNLEIKTLDIGIFVNQLETEPTLERVSYGQIS